MSSANTKSNKFVNLLFINTELRETTFKKTIIFYIVMAVLFIALSITLFVVMNQVREASVLYYTPMNKTACNFGQNCTASITLTKSM